MREAVREADRAIDQVKGQLESGHGGGGPARPAADDPSKAWSRS